ncbi:MAG TPA: hypothetical protein GXZ24_01425 [Firmicutes bacterium]|nr:hypothetical protein [Bacillota bacterium]
MLIRFYEIRDYGMGLRACLALNPVDDYPFHYVTNMYVPVVTVVKFNAAATYRTFQNQYLACQILQNFCPVVLNVSP